MASLFAPKVLLGVLGVGATGGTVAIGYKVFSKDNKHKEKPIEEQKPTFSVADLLKKDKTKELLMKEGKNGEDEDWKKAWSNYKNKNSSVTTNGLDPLGIVDFVNKKNDDNAPEDFLNKCDLESKKQVYSEKDEAYLKVSTWCTKEVTASQS
ncbi:hypothetical protein MHC_04860 [Mycoplasma haemocanis str. Illinois]|uniref:Uncharacterized protein n=1 Tax=Mycoplasma haemocanis (strain Illinois) TaxID=1111676 RepID=H6N856_MYCHN|nr:hypothetical protein [Mycoplasma haemocanis]AEW45828.1 hypothetical protein MHC_04860 [Mycoplasma haemocanis str. Illinois]